MGTGVGLEECQSHGRSFASESAPSLSRDCSANACICSIRFVHYWGSHELVCSSSLFVGLQGSALSGLIRIAKCHATCFTCTKTIKSRRKPFLSPFTHFKNDRVQNTGIRKHSSNPWIQTSWTISTRFCKKNASQSCWPGHFRGFKFSRFAER